MQVFKLYFFIILIYAFNISFHFVGDKSTKFFMENWYLLRYLRFKSFDVEKTSEMMKYYYKQRKKHPEAFSVPVNMEWMLTYQGFYYLPYTDEQGRIIVVCDYCNYIIL